MPIMQAGFLLSEDSPLTVPRQLNGIAALDAAVLSLGFFPMLKPGKHGFHVGSDLFGGPLFRCHVGYTEINQLFLT